MGSLSHSEEQIKKNMDRMYRWTRHIYDASRKYYLLGRDVLIDRLSPEAGETVCEVGCGTARNLIRMKQKYPQARFYGLDASDEMLKTAQGNLSRSGLCCSVMLKQGFSQTFEPQSLFGLERPLDKIVFSYALSIIPPWQESINHALDLLCPGGEIHIVDFGGQEELPVFFRKFLFWWLRLFHVYHKPEILEYLKRLEHEKKGALRTEPLFRGYAYRAVFIKSP
ncbi:MAG: class I SAM-dependent methyltransferase [Rhodospirillales bacterium]|nr:class I SAM-dependent methyltransferase [Alphaproteobacteria bacterium]MCB1839187.1 class I SAM-dependent methyltransferase [Alphaproteobacteria bacterium]MCB9976112.1 class I SAM-dependent methyltransferase [Rhodospirillales bacterium]